MAALDLKGKKFGRLLALDRVPHQKGDRNAIWTCLCDCGNVTVVSASHLGKETFSCGCMQKEIAAELLRGNSHTATHHMTRTKEYRTWAKIKQRCYNPKSDKYRYYGGRGITMCDRWRDSFENFLEDMGKKPTPHHSIDRIDNQGSYSKSNCRWATRVEQQNNTSRNVTYEYKGQMMTLPQIIVASGTTLNPKTITARVYDGGWDVERAVNTPLLKVYHPIKSSEG